MGYPYLHYGDCMIKPNIYNWHVARLTDHFSCGATVGQPLTILFIDTGVDKSHSEIQGNLVEAECKSFVPYEPCISDYVGHGTQMVSSVTGKYILKGICPFARVVVYKITDKKGISKLEWLYRALEEGIAKGYPIINVSYRTEYEVDLFEFNRFQALVDCANAQGIWVVCSAGNDGRDITQEYRVPANLKGVYPIGSTNKNGDISGFSNTLNDQFFAPSGDEYEINYNNDWVMVAKSSFDTEDYLYEVLGFDKAYTVGIGTSIASALFSGVVASLSGELIAQGMNAGRTEMECLLRQGARLIDVQRNYYEVSLAGSIRALRQMRG
ncbi:hypothetical protein CPY53_19300 [Paenibacillus polymyxa]|uniref:PaenP n=2 Tax=Paenibacillus TaxID=44249 RepID=M1FQF6_PAEPO|nr:PaenP [Paenibacillus polymyxa OSY-DF]KKD55273.1 hypothetical protein C400_05415 [Paenibacillus sp. ICGEB2008]MBE3650585.1 S8 family serine peptidase [Paenibacillus polymyxa]NMP08367.1 S8 family serine peptidase [Paenibacillus polymyxa]PNQ84846.1 hypothetical protein C1T20_17315 [Paenibacillus polymyxa]